MPDLGNTSVFSQTDASNGSGTQPSWLGSAAPSTLDDAGRALQGAVTREWNWRSYTVTAAGTADAKTLTYSVAPAAYYNGQRFSFIANTTNTTTVTLNVNALGAITIKKLVAGVLTNLVAGDMVSGAYIEVAYNSANTCFTWVNRPGAALDAANTFTENQSIANGSSSAFFTLTSATATNKGLALQTSGANRWVVISNSTAESGSNVGSDFMISRYADAGTFLGNAFSVQRSTGYVGIGSITQDAPLVVDSTDANTKISIKKSGTMGMELYALAANYAVINAAASTPILFNFAGVEQARFNTTGDFTITASGKIGYGTGSGGAVTQTTSRTTGVTINKTNGSITLVSSANSTTFRSFTVTNSTVAATDTIIVSQKSGTDRHQILVTAVAAGSFEITYATTTGTTTEQPVFNFAVIKAVTA